MHTSTFTAFEVPAFLRVKFRSVELKQYVLETLSPSSAAHYLTFVVCLLQNCTVFQLADVEGLNNINQPEVEQVIVSCTLVVAVCNSLWGCGNFRFGIFLGDNNSVVMCAVP